MSIPRMYQVDDGATHTIIATSEMSAAQEWMRTMKELWGEDPDDYDFEVRELNPDKEYTLTMSDGEHKVTLTSRLWCELIGRGKTPFYLGCSEW